MNNLRITSAHLFPSILLLITLFINGCATNTKENVNYDPAVAGDFTSRSQLPKLTTDSENILVNKGYFKIGRIQVTQVIEDDGKVISQADSPTNLAAKEAAIRGADLLRLEKDNVRQSETRYKAGACRETRSEYKCHTVSGDIWREKCGIEFVCSQFEQIPYSYVTSLTTGSLWRHDPQRVASDQLLQKALAGGSTGELEKLLSLRSSVAEPLLDGRKPLAVAVQAGNVAAVRLILNKGARPDPTDLQVAINKGHGEIGKLLIKSGIAFNSNVSNNSQATLWSASAIGQAEMVEAALSNGAKINARDPADGQNALHKAAWGCHLAVVKTLIRRGADRSITTAEGERAIALARSSSEWTKRTPTERANCRAITMFLMK